MDYWRKRQAKACLLRFKVSLGFSLVFCKDLLISLGYSRKKPFQGDKNVAHSSYDSCSQASCDLDRSPRSDSCDHCFEKVVQNLIGTDEIIRYARRESRHELNHHTYHRRDLKRCVLGPVTTDRLTECQFLRLTIGAFISRHAQ